MITQHNQGNMFNVQLLLAGLNFLRKYPDRKDAHSRVWENVERIVMGIIRERVRRPGRSILGDLGAIPTQPSLAEVQKRFLWLSRQFPVHLKLQLVNTRDGERLKPGFFLHKSVPDGELQFGMLELVWRLFETGSYQRLGTCRVCGNWFYNAGRNKTKKSCSPHCRDRYWSRTARRQSAQQQSPETRREKAHAQQLKKERAKRVEEINRKLDPFLKKIRETD